NRSRSAASAVWARDHSRNRAAITRIGGTFLKAPLGVDRATPGEKVTTSQAAHGASKRVATSNHPVRAVTETLPHPLTRGAGMQDAYGNLLNPRVTGRVPEELSCLNLDLRRLRQTDPARVVGPRPCIG